MDEIEQGTFDLVIKVRDLSWKEIQQALEILAQKQISGVGLGKQSVDKLVRQGKGVTQIPIESTGISDFEKVARKYGIDFAIVKNSPDVQDNGSKEKTPTYSIFFKAQDADVMNAAFKEYVGIHLNQKTKPSILQKLHQMVKEVAKQAPDKVKNRHQERGER